VIIKYSRKRLSKTEVILCSHSSRENTLATTWIRTNSKEELIWDIVTIPSRQVLWAIMLMLRSLTTQINNIKILTGKAASNQAICPKVRILKAILCQISITSLMTVEEFSHRFLEVNKLKNHTWVAVTITSKRSQARMESLIEVQHPLQRDYWSQIVAQFKVHNKINSQAFANEVSLLAKMIN